MHWQLEQSIVVQYHSDHTYETIHQRCFRRRVRLQLHDPTIHAPPAQCDPAAPEPGALTEGQAIFVYFAGAEGEEIVLNHQGLVEKKDVFDDERAVLPASLLR